MVKYSQKFIKKTIKVWQPYFQTPLSEIDAIEITENMINFVKFLKVLNEKYKI